MRLCGHAWAGKAFYEVVKIVPSDMEVLHVGRLFSKVGNA